MLKKGKKSQLKYRFSVFYTQGTDIFRIFALCFS